MMHVTFVLNHTYNFTAGNVPLNAATGSTCDISPLLRFSFYQPMCYHQDDSDFPSESTEEHGRFVGISENAGHAMTFKILTSNTNKVLHRSNVRPADDPSSPNLRADPLTVPRVVKSLSDDIDESIFEEPPLIDEDDQDAPPQPKSRRNMPIIDPSDLMGRSFLRTEEDRQRLRVKIVKAIKAYEDELDKNPDRRQFICSTKDDQVEEILTYNEILELIEDQQEEDAVEWRFKSIKGHEGPLKWNHPNYKGSSCNVMIEWENGEITFEPLSIIGADDPVTCANYARDNYLLDTPGWTRFKRLAKREKKLLCSLVRTTILTSLCNKN